MRYIEFIKMKKITFLLIFFVISCGSTEKLKKDTQLSNKNLIKYDLKVSEFPKQEMIVKDVNFIGYFNADKAVKSKSLKLVKDFLDKKYFLKGKSIFYFTLSDIYKSQEFLIFINGFKFNNEDKSISIEKKEAIGDKEIISIIKTDNQEFSYVNLNDGSIYGDNALVKELFNIYDKKLEPISDERYTMFSDSSFLKSDKVFKLIFMPNAEYKKLLIEYSNKQPLLKPIFDGLKYFLFELSILKEGNLNLKFVINSKKESIDLIYNFISTQKKLLITLGGNPFSRLNSSNFTNKIALFKDLEFKKIDDETFALSIDLKESDMKIYLNLIKKLLKTYIK